MSAENLSLIAGTVLSLIFSYIPGAKEWYLQFNGQAKRLIMLGLISLSAGVVFGLSCLGWGSEFGITLGCDQAGFFGLVRQIVLAIIANQGIYAISPHSTPKPKIQSEGSNPHAASSGSKI
ncbi:MAG: hypothetical protein JJE12_14070 [Anaerolineales bacterium]|nr:hypothetical protein [Anaerolineales bacterium]